MALNDDDKREIRELFQEVLEAYFKSRGLSETSFIEDHLFLQNWRCNIKTVRKAGLWTATMAVVSGLIALIWTSIKG